MFEWKVLVTEYRPLASHVRTQQTGGSLGNMAQIYPLEGTVGGLRCLVSRTSPAGADCMSSRLAGLDDIGVGRIYNGLLSY